MITRFTRRGGRAWRALPAGLTLTALLACVPLGAAGPNPSAPFVESITYGGTGCPQGTVGQTITSARTQYVLGFDQWIASSGPAVPVTEGRKACQVNVNLRVPPHSPVAFLTMVMRGFVQLPAGVRAETSTIAYLAGDTTQTDQPAAFAGPVAKTFETRFPIKLKLPNSKTTAVIPINFKIDIRLIGPPSAAAMMTTDYLTAQLASNEGKNDQ
jgi:hypothetical protein